MITFNLYSKIPSCNEYILQCRRNKFAGAKIKKDIENKIIYELKEQGVKRKAKKTNEENKPYLIIFEWYEKTRRRDKDNISFGKKFILDALQKEGVLINDNNNYIIGFKDLFYYDKSLENNYVKITLDTIN